MNSSKRPHTHCEQRRREALADREPVAPNGHTQCEQRRREKLADREPVAPKDRLRARCSPAARNAQAQTVTTSGSKGAKRGSKRTPPLSLTLALLVRAAREIKGKFKVGSWSRTR